MSKITKKKIILRWAARTAYYHAYQSWPPIILNKAKDAKGSKSMQKGCERECRGHAKNS